jgi:hypothetical protein
MRSNAKQIRSIALKWVETNLFQKEDVEGRNKEGIRMSKKSASKLAATKKWLDRNSDIGITVKPAQTALASAEKSVAESAAAKARLAEAESAKKKAFAVLEDAIAKAKTEKKLKNRGAKIQAKLALLSPGA